MRTRFIGLLALSLVVLVAWFAMAFKPSQHKLSDVRAQVTTTQAQVAQLTAKLQELQALKADAPHLRAEAAKFTHALPSEPRVSDFIIDVQDAADAAGISFLSIAPSLPGDLKSTAPAAVAPTTTTTSPAPSPTPAGSPAPDAAVVPPPAPVSPLRAISMSISATGKFFAVEDFISKLEGLKRALRIDTFSLTGGSSASGAAPAVGAPATSELTVSLQLQVFMSRAAATVTPVTTPTTSTGGGL